MGPKKVKNEEKGAYKTKYVDNINNNKICSANIINFLLPRAVLFNLFQTAEPLKHY